MNFELFWSEIGYRLLKQPGYGFDLEVGMVFRKRKVLCFTLLLYSLIKLFLSVDTNTRSLGEAGLSCSCIRLTRGIEFSVTLGIRKGKL